MTTSGNSDNLNNYPPIDQRKILVFRRSSLIQQAKGLEEQRRAILGEVGEIEKVLNVLDGEVQCS